MVRRTVRVVGADGSVEAFADGAAWCGSVLCADTEAAVCEYHRRRRPWWRRVYVPVE